MSPLGSQGDLDFDFTIAGRKLTIKNYLDGNTLFEGGGRLEVENPVLDQRSDTHFISIGLDGTGFYRKFVGDLISGYGLFSSRFI